MRCFAGIWTQEMDTTEYPASSTAFFSASSEAVPETVAVLVSRSTLAVTPGRLFRALETWATQCWHCLLYTSDVADEL